MKWSALHPFMPVFVVTRQPAFAGIAQGYESGRVAVASRDTFGSARRALLLYKPNRFFGRVSMANFRGCRFHMGPALTICCNLNTDAFVTNRPWRSMKMVVGCQHPTCRIPAKLSCRIDLFSMLARNICHPPTRLYLKHKEANSLHWASHLPAKGKTWKASNAVATVLDP